MLGTAVSRLRWLAAYAVNALAGATVLLVLGAAVLGLVVLLPRWAVGASWTLLVAAIVVGPMFGPALSLPDRLLDLSPFTHVPNAPAVAVDAAPVLGLLAAGVLLAAVGAAGMRRRDLQLPA